MKQRYISRCAAAIFLLQAVAAFPQAQTPSPEFLYNRGVTLTLLARPDYVGAAELFRQAAERGLPRAQRFLGELYRDGRGVPRNDAEAVRWIRKAANHKDARAQSDLGNLYATGRGVQRDDWEASKWFAKAAKADDAEAQLGLGILYANGRGVQRNDVTAVKWYRLAAEQGVVLAQFALGTIFEKGMGKVPPDHEEAILWYTKALRQGFEGARQPLAALRNIQILTEQDAAANLLTPLVRIDPQEAKDTHLRATVRLRLLVDAEGKVSDAEVLSGHPLLDEAALQAVRPLRYRPYIVNGQPSSFVTTITIPYVF